MNFMEQRKAKREARLAKYKEIETKGFVEVPDTRKGKGKNRVWACFPCEKLYPRVDGKISYTCTTCKEPCVAATDIPGKDFFKENELQEIKAQGTVQIKSTVRAQQLAFFVKRVEELRSDGRRNFVLSQHKMFFPKDVVPAKATTIMVELKVHYYLYIQTLLEKGIPVPHKVRSNYEAACAYNSAKLTKSLQQVLVGEI